MNDDDRDITIERQVWLQLLRPILDERDAERATMASWQDAVREAYDLLCDGVEVDDTIVYDLAHVDAVRQSLSNLLDRNATTKGGRTR